MESEFVTADGQLILVPAGTRARLPGKDKMDEILRNIFRKLWTPVSGDLEIEVDLHQVVGSCGCVSASMIGRDDTDWFAYRPLRPKPSRVVTNVTGPDTSIVTIMASRSPDEPNAFVLLTAYYGPKSPREPWDRKIQSQEEFQQSLEFWSCHALIHGPGMEAPFKSTLNTQLRR